MKNILIDEIKHFSSIEIAGPGFLNIKLSTDAWLFIINNIRKK
jgi:Arginyl-tRNA synthetase